LLLELHAVFEFKVIYAFGEKLLLLQAYVPLQSGLRQMNSRIKSDRWFTGWPLCDHGVWQGGYRDAIAIEVFDEGLRHSVD
jgi:hypothetical protein